MNQDTYLLVFAPCPDFSSAWPCLENVYLALLGGLFSAGLLLETSVLAGLWKVMDIFLVGALADRDHAKIIIFSLLIASMVEVMRRCGAAQDLIRLDVPSGQKPKDRSNHDRRLGIGGLFR